MSDRLIRQADIIPTEALNASIAVLGVGGVGTWIAVGATMMGIEKIYLIDDDLVDEHNLNRQFFQEKHIGTPKVNAMMEIVKSINSAVEVFPYNARIESLDQIPADVDIVMSGVDNYEARFMLEEWANKNKDKLVIDMGTTESATGGTALMMRYGKTPSYKSFLGADGVKAAEEEMQTPACSRNPEPAIVTTSAMVAFLGLDLLRQYLTTKAKKRTKIYKGIFTVSLGKRPCVDFGELETKGWRG